MVFKEQTSPPFTEEQIFERLPAYYQEQPGALRAIVRGTSESLRVLEGDLARWKTLWQAGDGLASRACVLTQLAGAEVSPFTAADCERRPATTAAFVAWLRGRVGVDPVLWPGVRLEPSGEPGKGLETRLEPACLAVIWDIDARIDPEALPRSRESCDGDFGNGELPSEFRRPGLRVQYAKIGRPFPNRPAVNGLELQGELLG